MDLNGSQTWRFNHHAVTACQCWDRVPQNGVKRWSPWSNYSNYTQWVTRRIADGIWNVMNWINFKGFMTTVAVKQTWNLFAFLHDFQLIKGVRGEWSFKKHRSRSLIFLPVMCVSTLQAELLFLFWQRKCTVRKGSACWAVRLAVSIFLLGS